MKNKSRYQDADVIAITFITQAMKKIQKEP